MAEGTQSTFSGSSKSIVVIGDFCYGYSGLLNIDDTETTMLESTTGNYTSVVRIQFGNLESTGQDFLFQMYLNDQLVAALVTRTAITTAKSGTESGVKMVIPPYTTIKVTGDNKESSTAKNWVCNLSGRIY